MDLFKSSDKRTIAKGYWQSEKYFRNIEQTIRQDLTLKEKQNETFNNILLQIESCTSISLHIRRTDYLISKHRQIYNICSKEYYEQALKIITNKVSDRSKLFVFSDDINWVKNNLTFSVPTIFVSDNGFKDYQDLILMSTCKHNITANSTLSWWGAWLNGNKGKIVITPEKWYLNSKIDNKDLIPETWIRV